MIDRRHFNLAAAATLLSTSALPLASRAQQKKVFRLGSGASVNDAQQCFMTCGRHPSLGYYAAEGVDIEYVNMSNVSQTMQSIITGETDFGTIVPPIFFGQAAKEPQLGVVAVYNWLPRTAYVLCVKPDSTYKTLADLKGRRIGIRNQGDAGPLILRAMFKEMGIEDSGLSYIAIGDGGPAGTALHRDRVDAIVSFDTAAARVELAGFPLRYLPLTPGIDSLSSAWYGVSQKALDADRKAYVGLFRAAAKSTLFAHTNLDEAIKLHWELYLESRPKSKTDAEGMQDVKVILARRKDNWIRREDDPEKRIGYMNPEDVKANLNLAVDITKDPQLPAKLGDVNKWVTNDLIDEVNAFDNEAVIKQAREYSLSKK